MGLTCFPNGVSSFGIPIWGNGIGPLGPATGNVYYLLVSKDSTDPYYTLLHNRGIPDASMFSTLEAAQDAMTTNQGDTLIVMPGLHTETVTCNWAKNRCHIVGAGSPTSLLTGYSSSRSGGAATYNTTLYTDTAAVDYVLHITGDNCEFYNLAIQNGLSGGSATSSNLAAAYVGGDSNYFRGVHFQGLNSTAQAGAAACSSLNIGAGWGGHIFEDCVIGNNTFCIARTVAAQGQLLFSDADVTPNPQHGMFRNCTFLSRGETAAVVMVYSTGQYGSDRTFIWDHCNFVNHSVNWAFACTYVFDWPVGAQTAQHLLRDCACSGYTYWYDGAPLGAAGSILMTATPISGQGGGIARTATAAAGS